MPTDIPTPWLYRQGEKVQYTPISKNVGTVKTRFRNAKGENLYVVETEFEGEFIIRTEKALGSYVSHSGLGNLPACKGFFPPEGGFKREHWYVAEVAYGMSNPIHEVLLYAGLCDDGSLQVGNYAYLAGPHYHLADHEARVSTPVYLRVVRDLGILVTERT